MTWHASRNIRFGLELPETFAPRATNTPTLKKKCNFDQVDIVWISSGRLVDRCATRLFWVCWEEIRLIYRRSHWKPMKFPKRRCCDMKYGRLSGRNSALLLLERRNRQLINWFH